MDVEAPIFGEHVDRQIVQAVFVLAEEVGGVGDREDGADGGHRSGRQPAQWRAGLPVPWQQFVELTSRMFGDAGEDVGEPGLRIDVIHLGGLCRSPNYAERAPFSSGFVLIDV